jgi:uncharacterized protein (UPF0548 family)
MPAGYHHFHCERALGIGDDVFARAVAGLRSWAPQRGAGLSVLADAELAVGTNVAMAAPLPIGFTFVTCRVVAVDDEPDRFAYAYGTLPVHPEQGEERFEVVRTGEAVTLRIVVFSRPQQLAARLAGPVARMLQARATSRYLDAMEAVASGRELGA